MIRKAFGTARDRLNEKIELHNKDQLHGAVLSSRSYTIYLDGLESLNLSWTLEVYEVN